MRSLSNELVFNPPRPPLCQKLPEVENSPFNLPLVSELLLNDALTAKGY